MKTAFYFILATAFLMMLGACTRVSSGAPTANNYNGDAWYVKKTTFLGLPVSTHIYYCPKQQNRGPAKCVEAIVHDGGQSAVPAAPAYGAPAAPAYGAPAAPAYGAPAAPPVNQGYGAPANPGYGAPVAPQPQPAAPGYSQPVPAPAPPSPGY